MHRTVLVFATWCLWSPAAAQSQGVQCDVVPGTVIQLGSGEIQFDPGSVFLDLAVERGAVVGPVSGVASNMVYGRCSYERLRDICIARSVLAVDVQPPGRSYFVASEMTVWPHRYEPDRWHVLFTRVAAEELSDPASRKETEMARADYHCKLID